MQKMIQRYFLIVLMAAGVQAAWGFSLLGPLPPDAGGETWQVATIGYNQPYEGYALPGDPVWLGDIGGPHNIGEEYRRNVPVLYYSYDASFLAGDYFDTNATAAIDGAFGVMNSLTNVDSYSSGLTEFPLNSQNYNYQAQSLYLTDLKSVTLHLLVEQLGLADPARYSWTLHDRFAGAKCPITTTYLVVQRNFDGTTPTSLQTSAYSPYVNGALLTYYITEACGGTPYLSTTVPYLVDSDGLEYAPVAANNFQEYEEYATMIQGQGGIIQYLPTIYGLQIGGYYTGLTRDDVAGLRYLYSTNNVNREPIAAGSDSFIVTTNYTQPLQLFPNLNDTNTLVSGTNGGGYYYYDGNYGYGDYGALIASSKTNSPAVLQALYPGLVVSSYSNYFALATNTTVVSYYTNYIGAPAGAPVLVTVTNYGSLYLQEYYADTFANVFTNHFYKNTYEKLLTTTVGPLVGAPVGTSPFVTNYTSKSVTLTNVPSGDFFLFTLFQTNVCPLAIYYTGLTNVLAITNLITAASTNVSAATNGNTYSSTTSLVTYFTNYTFVTYPVTCNLTPTDPELYQGIGGVKFARADYDSLLGQYWQPVTNNYTMYYVTNYQLHARSISRVVTQPDILLTAEDTADGPAGINSVYTVERGITFNSGQEIAGLRGPGIIDATTVFNYNKVGSIFENGPFADANSFINPEEVNQTTQIPQLQWASYDGSTNPPVIYPNGTSVQNIEYQMVVQVSPSSIPAEPAAFYATNSVQFSVTGGPLTPPYTWSASGVQGELGSGLPNGLLLTSDGLLYGVTTSTGTYDFTLTLTDSSAVPRSVQWVYSITLQ